MGPFEDIKQQLPIFRNMYDFARIVDPIAKTTLILKENNEVEIGDTCSDFWKKGLLCDNCISMRAYSNNDVFVKIEYTGKKTFIVSAIPFEYNSKIYIVEFLKEMKENEILAKNCCKPCNSENLINEINNKVIKYQLTEIYNRRFISEQLPVDIESSSYEKKPLSVIRVNKVRLEKLQKKIEELRDILNELCDNGVTDERLIVSQNLDKLIVEYMNQLKENQEPFYVTGT